MESGRPSPGGGGRDPVLIPGRRTTLACVGLGSNLGDREANLSRALGAMEGIPGVRRVAVSTIRETEPVGGPPQGEFLNAAAALATSLGARELFDRLMGIERAMGRVRRVRWGPRVIDLDLLLFGGEILDDADLRVPHPRMCRRRFVLEPLAEIVPGAVHPGEGRTVAELLARLDLEEERGGGAGERG